MKAADVRLRAGPGGGWESAKALPHASLRSGVLVYHGFRLALDRPRVRLEAPIAAATLLLAFDDQPITIVRSDRPHHPVSRVSVMSGLRTCATLATHDGRLHGVEVSLTPWLAFALSGTDQSELAAESVDPLSLPGSWIRALTDEMAGTPGWERRFALLDAALAARAAAGPQPAPQVVRAWELLSRSGGRIPIRRLAEEVGWSARQLERRFGQQIGQTPKAAARVLRLQRARRQLAAGRPPGAVAADCGFFDQAHLCREFKAMTDLTPTEFVEHRELERPDPADSDPHAGHGGPAGPPLDRLPGEATSIVLSG
jgi:AraC-like DNA-binding protein